MSRLKSIGIVGKSRLSRMVSKLGMCPEVRNASTTDSVAFLMSLIAMSVMFSKIVSTSLTAESNAAVTLNPLSIET